MRAMVMMAVLALLCSMAPSEARQNDGVRLWVELAPQWSQRYQVRARLELAQEGAGELLEQDAVVRLVAVSIRAGDGDGAEPQAPREERPRVRASIERLTVKHTAGGETRTFTWPERDEPLPAGGGEGAGGGGGAADRPALARIGRALAASVLEFELGPDGRAILTSGLETAMLAVEEAQGGGHDGSPVRYLGVFAPGAADRLMTSILTLDPERRSRAVGDTWRTRIPARALGREAQIITESTLKNLEGNIASVEGEITLELAPARAVPTLPRTTTPEHAGSLAARWDVREGRLISHLWETRTVWESALATEPPIVSRTTNIARIEITLERGPAPPP
jgi:hypothetical protein